MKRKASDYERLYVHADFKRMLKVEAAKKGFSIMKYTQSISSMKPLNEKGTNEKNKRFEFGF